jgi:hypothetical protein
MDQPRSGVACMCGDRAVTWKWGMPAAVATAMVWVAAAQGQLAITPIILEPRAYAGGIQTVRVSISNTGEKPMACAVTLFAMEIDAGGMPLAVAEAPRTCRDWITITPQKFTLAAGQGERLVCHIRAPRETSGGYYAILSVHGTPQVPGGEDPTGPGVSAGIRLSHRALVPILLTVPGSNVEAIIDAAKPTITPHPSGRGFAMIMPVRNRGNIHTRMTGTVEIRSQEGQLVEKFELSAGRGYLLPQHERLFRSRTSLSLSDGEYIAKAQLDTAGAPPMHSEFPLYVDHGVPVVEELSDEMRQRLRRQSAGFVVFPSQLSAALPAGGTRMQAVELVNLTNEPIPVVATVREWYRTADGHDLVLDEPAPHGRSGLGWLALRQKEITLRPLSRQRVPLVVTPPRGATGERYAAVVFDRADRELEATPEARARRSAMLALVCQGTGVPKAEITEFNAERRPNGVIEVTLRCRNSGDVAFVPEAAFAILSEATGATYSVPVAQPGFAVQAGGEAVIKAEFSTVLNEGLYAVQATLRYSGDLPPVMRRTVFDLSAPPVAVEHLKMSACLGPEDVP